MYQLKNKFLSVDIVDPINDRELLGSRYCTGGYIYQIYNQDGKALLSGPSYPQVPDTFDGQGAPETFVKALEASDNKSGDKLAVIGVGTVVRSIDDHPFDPRFNRQVIEWLDWEISKTENSISMTSQHSFQDWAYQITCEVSLEGNTIHSKTSVTSLGNDPLPIQWFPHPFFPVPSTQQLFTSSVDLTGEVTHPYSLDESGFINRHSDFDWKAGAYLALDFDNKGKSGTENYQKHDLSEDIQVKTDYSPSFYPIWGNDKCFSFEPYFETQLTVTQSANWQVSYSIAN